MSITVYWACLEPNWMMAEEPVSIFQKFVAGKDREDNVERCPAVRDYFRNLYGLTSMYDFEVRFTELNELYATEGNDDLFHAKILLRSSTDKLVSFTQNYVFFTDADSLLMTGQLFPFLEDNSVTQTCRPIPGQFDIGKWFRPLEFSVYMNDDCFKIDRGEIYQYVQFHTDEKIEFQKFIPTQKIHSYAQACTGTVSATRQWRKPLSFFYKNFSIKEHVLAEIRANLCD
jgi:hypothetical protein